MEDPVYASLRRRRNLFGALAAVFLVLIVASAVLDEATSVVEDTSFGVSPSPGLVIRDGVGGGLRGGIEVKAGEDDRIHVAGEVHATWRVRYRLEKIGNDVVLDVQAKPFLSWLNLLGPARFSVTAPRDTRLDVASTSAPISVQGITGGGTVRTTNGRIHLDAAGGKLLAKTTNGAVVATGLDGSASLETTNGGIKVERSRGAFEIKTTNGGIILDAELAPDARHRARTTNGGIRVRLRGEPSLRVDAQTTNGSVVTRRTLRVAQATRTELVGTLGSGSGELSLRTTNGGIAIE